MNYEELQIKDRYNGDILMNNIKSFTLNDELTTEDKKYIYLTITKHVFTIFPDVEEIKEEIKEDKSKVKINKPKTSKAKTKK